MSHPIHSHAADAKPEPPGHTRVVFFIDKAKFTADTNVLTPREILTEYAKEDPSQTTLVRVLGKDKEKLQDLDNPIEVKDGTHFTVLHHGPTPVS
jgi:hypothetical protein